MNHISNILAYTFATMAGLCFVSGIAILSSGGSDHVGKLK